MALKHLAALCGITLLFGCSSKQPHYLNPDEKQISRDAKLSLDEIARIESHQLYELSERDVDQYLRYLHEKEPDLKKRVATLAQKNIGQPYELYLLGEAPFEPYDSQPLVSIGQSDCVVFAEHTYAMALGSNWNEFFKILQRIRYNNGEIGVVSRNHYTEGDWNKNNTWLVQDMSQDLLGENAASYKQTVNREGFFANRYGIDVDIEKEKITEYYVPFDQVASIEDQLQTGDTVNFVRGKINGGKWVGHVGMIYRSDDDVVYVIHSTSPQVRIDNLQEMCEKYIERQTEMEEEAAKLEMKESKKPAADRKRYTSTIPYGFKFLRLQDDPMANLREIDGENAPVITWAQEPYDYLSGIQ